MNIVQIRKRFGVYEAILRLLSKFKPELMGYKFMSNYFNCYNKKELGKMPKVTSPDYPLN